MNRSFFTHGISAWLIIACRVAMAADTPAVLIQKTDPNAGISKVGVVFDVADVELVVDKAGVPFSLKSSIGLPEYVANSIEGWRYSPYLKGNRAVPFSTKFQVKVARKITPVIEQNLGVFWHRAGDEVGQAIRQGRELNQQSADALETGLTDNEASTGQRISLLVYYSKDSVRAAAKTDAKRAKLLTWLVDHEPQSDILGSPFALVNSSEDADTAAKLTDKWMEEVKQHPADTKIVVNALNFLCVANPPKAIEMLAAYYNHKNETTEWAGRIYGLAALGVVSLSTETGKTVSADDSLAKGTFAATAREKLVNSTDAKMTLGGLNVMMKAARSLAAANKLPDIFKDFCPGLLAHAKTFSPETTQSCDIAIQQSDDQDVPLAIDQKLAEARVVKKVVPIYPQEAKNMGITGTVLLSAIVSKTGDIDELGFTSGPFVLYHSALNAVKGWRWRPTQMGGRAVDVSTVVTVNYTLSR